jgi:hypothetical protein
MPDRYKIRHLIAAFVAIALGYFFVFPNDTEQVIAVLQTIRKTIAHIRSTLEATKRVSPWLYFLLGSGLVIWTIRKKWSHISMRRSTPPTSKPLEDGE